MVASKRLLVERSAKVFVIPNAGLLPVKDARFQPCEESGTIPQRYTLDAWEELCVHNNTEFDPSEPLVELCFHSEESEDMVTEPVEVWTGNRPYYMHIPSSSWVPSSLLRELKEGESIRLNIPVQLRRVIGGKSDTIFANLAATLTADQLHSKYRAFGPFEKAVQSVIAASNALYAAARPHNFQWQDPDRE